MMAIPAGKTPISYLQEYCTKRGLTPQYELLSHEGAVHDPTFIMQVSVADTTAEGKGNSKKKAKHYAARAALNVLIGVLNNEEAENEGEVETKKEGDKVGNPVGELQELTQKRLMKPPTYTFDNEQGPPHDRSFVCTLKLGKFTHQGSGRSKKAAKRCAAAAMLEQIKELQAKSGGEEEQALKEEPEDEEDSPVGSSYSSLKNQNQPSSCAPLQSKELQLFYETVMESSGKKLKSAAAPAPASNFCQMLQEIADAKRFEVALYDLQDRTTTGHYQTIIKLSLNPVTVCHGSGTSVEDARASSAHSALQYLRLLMKQ